LLLTINIRILANFESNLIGMKKSGISANRILGIVAFVFIFTTFNGCRNGARNDKDNVIVTSWPSQPTTLNPVCGIPSSARVLIFDYTQKTLTRTDLRTLQEVPILVKSLAEVSPDGKSFSYTLRDDVKWDDGSPLTVDDVIFTMKVTKCPLADDALVRSTYDNVKDIVKDPSNPQRFTMIAKDLYFNNKFIFNELYLIEKKHWDSSGVLDKAGIPDMDDPKFDPSKYAGLADWMKGFNDGRNGHDPKKLCGLGGYAVTDWVVNTSITLTRKNNWWGENDTSAYSRTYPSKIVIKIIADDQSGYLALLNHSLDVDVWQFTNSYLKLKQNKDFNDHYYSGTTDQVSCNLLFMNMKPEGKNHPPFFTDKKVRWAMAYLTPVDEMNSTIIKGLATRQVSFIQPLFKNFYNDTLKLIPLDIEKAKKLLGEAGWVDTDGDNIRDKVINGKKVQLSFRLMYSATPTNKEYALLLKDAMYKAGVDVVPDPVDQGELQTRAAAHDFDMMLSAFSGPAYPDDPGQLFDSKNWTNHGSNFTGFGNASTDSLIEQSNRQIDDDKRAVLLKKLQAIVYDQQPIIYLYGIKRKVIISKKYENPGMYVERPGVMLNDLKLK